MRSLVLAAVLLTGCEPALAARRNARTDYARAIPMVAVAIESTRSVEKQPDPTPQPTNKCTACDGTGKNGDGANARVCWKCNGTGKSAGDSDSADGAADRIIPRPRVQVVIYSDSPRCAPCRQLIARLKQRLVEDVRARGERPWNVGEEQSNQFWICEFAEHQKEFERRGIRQMPTLFFVVDGEEKETTKRDPAELAAEYLKRLESIK